jgi:predicted  nucleic acid-binding Zn-ribbon protein
MEESAVRLPEAERQLTEVSAALSGTQEAFEAYRRHTDELQTAHQQLDSRCRALEAELQAYRSRISSVAADRIVTVAKRVPFAPNVGRHLRRLLRRDRPER